MDYFFETHDSIAQLIAHNAVVTLRFWQKPCWLVEYISCRYGYKRSTKTLAIQRYQIEVTEIGRKFYGVEVGLFYFGMADKYANCNSTELGSCIH